MDAAANFYNTYSSTFALLGVGLCGWQLIKLICYILKAVRSFLLAPLLNLGLQPKKLGSWAVVTGATDGIGKAYAIALAKKGANIVLISRTASKLDAVAEEISAVANVQTKCITADFSGGVDIYGSIYKDLEGLDIGILINNVGMSYEYPEYLHQVPNRDETFDRMLHINIFSVTFMTTMILPQMVAKRKGAIVNIGSASCFGFPLLTVYAASKAYVDSFSKNLAVEYADKGVLIQSVMPGHVATKMTGMKPNLFAPSAEDYAQSALTTIDIEPVTFGYWSHWLLMSIYLVLRHPGPIRYTRIYLHKNVKDETKSVCAISKRLCTICHRYNRSRRQHLWILVTLADDDILLDCFNYTTWKVPTLAAFYRRKQNKRL
ncbi:very-long-chain 3-oxoacyl-CoA reductase-like isoform X1 [Watersipora subatra]|uniref:very-long-chain 3-oxoacyl-CoA reductase-like isoform X1 n=1 Tax=Watersipora subatra TaxID=2589382 RepID=UPI00355B8DD5